MKKRKKIRNLILWIFKRVIFIFIIITLLNSVIYMLKIKRKNDDLIFEKKEEVSDLQKSILKESAYAETLKDTNTSWRKSLEDIEEIARKELNLIKKDEILIIPENK